ncbi:hypothetical protein ABZV75_15690, partial [Streptomyces flaveolus]|uniref:SCO2400 family protein n=1 Tax=Streptomyces flaveolus TaxID=67297 RepID=UPI00348F8D43
MNYCLPCQRHLNGALACPGCGTPAARLAAAPGTHGHGHGQTPTTHEQPYEQPYEEPHDGPEAPGEPERAEEPEPVEAGAGETEGDYADDGAAPAGRRARGGAEGSRRDRKA